MFGNRLTVLMSRSHHSTSEDMIAPEVKFMSSEVQSQSYGQSLDLESDRRSSNNPVKELIQVSGDDALDNAFAWHGDRKNIHRDSIKKLTRNAFEATRHSFVSDQSVNRMDEYWPNTVSVLYVSSLNRPDFGLAYIASGIRKQDDDLGLRRPRRGPNIPLHGDLENDINPAVDEAINETTIRIVGAQIIETPCERTRTIRLPELLVMRGNACVEHCAAKSGGSLPQRHTDLHTRLHDGSTYCHAEMPACPKAFGVEKCKANELGSGKECYPNITSAGCKHFHKLFNIEGLQFETFTQTPQSEKKGSSSSRSSEKMIET